MPSKSRKRKYEGRGVEERYINNQYLQAIAGEYDKDSRFSAIPLNEKMEVLEVIRHVLTYEVYDESGRTDGEKEMAKWLFDTFHGDIDPSFASRFSFLPLGIILSAIQKTEKTVIFYFREKVAIPEGDNQFELKETYLTLISEATIRMIEEVALVFGHDPGQQQEDQASASNEQPSHGSAAHSEQVKSFKPCLKRARSSLETEEEKIDEMPKNGHEKPSVTWAPSLT